MSPILIAEADALVTAFIARGAVMYDLDVAFSDDGHEAMMLATSGEYEILVVDDRLPNGEILRAVKHWGPPRPPIILLTGGGRPRESAARFELSLGDVLTKPFRFRDLLARIREHQVTPPDHDAALLQIGRATLDLRSHQIAIGGRSVQLTASEFAFVHSLFRDPGRVHTGEELLREHGKPQPSGGVAAVEAQLNELNRKLGRTLIGTVRWVGFRLELGEPSGR